MTEKTKRGISLPTALVVGAVLASAAFAAGRSTSSGGSPIAVDPGTSPSPFVGAAGEHPASNDVLPPGHPAIDPTASAMGLDHAAESDLAWDVPRRWNVMPNTSAMRLATYRVPRVPGDPDDCDVSVMQAGGSVDDNLARWIGQFGPDGARTAKRTVRTVAGLTVTLLEVEGTYDGGMMSKDGRALTGWALYGAIVETSGMPHFFKMTGPAKSVAAAKGELDELVTSLRNGAR